MEDYDGNIVKKIMDETGYSHEMAISVSEGLKKRLHPSLSPLAERWMNGETPDFEFQKITLHQIMDRERISYVSALFQMSILIKNPKLASSYKNFDFRIKCASARLRR